MHAIRNNVKAVFAPLNIKLISKRAERHYPNGYCVYVLYCNRCQKRKPTYQCSKRYKKRSTNCPFTLKFTKNNKEKYRLTDGTFYHNHELTTPVLDPEILAQLDTFDPTVAKPANIKRYIQSQFGKEISYAQLAYEMSKRKTRVMQSLGSTRGAPAGTTDVILDTETVSEMVREAEFLHSKDKGSDKSQLACTAGQAIPDDEADSDTSQQSNTFSLHE